MDLYTNVPTWEIFLNIVLFSAHVVAISISGGSSVSQNKLPQLILGYIYILKYLQSNFIG